MQELDISTPSCLVAQEEGVLFVTLNRPEAKNAFNPAMLLGMYRAWRRLDEDPALRCAILTARGNTFCAGMDLKAAGQTIDSCGGGLRACGWYRDSAGHRYSRRG